MVDQRAVTEAMKALGRKSKTLREGMTAAIEAYEAAKWRPIHEIPITPNAPVYPTYVELFNGHHVGIGYAQISEDGEEKLEFWSETAEPVEPKPTMFRTIDRPKQDAVCCQSPGPPESDEGVAGTTHR